jgi:hypothetical protein
MASASESTASPRSLHTYHCLCSHLLLASTQPLYTLTRRTGRDKSFILQLPPPPHAGSTSSDYAILLGAALDRNLVVIRSTDGFEKRYLQRCGRCRLVVGYQLDKSQYEGAEEVGRKDNVVYLLPGGLVETNEMVAGKDMTGGITLGEGSSATITAT